MPQAIPGLVWLRAICIVFVIFIHAFIKYAQCEPLSAQWLISLSVEAIARLGLTCFFVLSGFFLLRPYPDAGAILHFYRSRALRILPLFLFWSLVYYVYATHSLNLADFFVKIIAGPVFYHLWFVYAILGIYLVAPFVANLIAGASARALALFCVFSMCVYSFEQIFEHFSVNKYFYEYLIPFWMLYFLGGYLIRQRFAHGWPRRLSPLKVSLAFIACLLAVFFLSFFSKTGRPLWDIVDIHAYDGNIFAYGATLSFFVLVFKTFVFSPPAFIVFLARRSYGIYLSHALYLAIYETFIRISPWYLNALAAVAFTLACCLATEWLLLAAKNLRPRAAKSPAGN